MAARNSERAKGSDQVITGRDIVRLIRRGALFATILAAAAGAAAYYVSSISTPVYSAQVGVVASQPGSQYSDLSIITPPTVDPGVYQSVILQGDVVERALTRVDGDPPSGGRLERIVDATSVRVDDAQRSSTIWIEVRHTSPSFAADLVNAIADELIVWDRERARRALDRSISAIERSIAEIDERIAEATDDGDDAARVAALRSLREQRSQELETAIQTSTSALVVGLLEPLRTASPPERPIAPRERFNTVVAALLGLILGYGMQVLRWTLDSRVGGRDEVIAATGLPVLAEFPKRARGARRLSTEAAGFFHTNVMLATRSAKPRSIVVTSPAKTEEKEGVAMSLAESFARSGQRTLLVDADLRHVGVTEELDLVPSSVVTLDAYLADPERSYLPVSVAIDGRQSFDFIPSFTSERFPVVLLNEGFDRCLQSWSTRYDVIVLDSAPVAPFADTLAIAPSCTGLVLCASVERSSGERLHDAIELLDGPHITVLGIALTDVRGRPQAKEGREPDGSSSGRDRTRTRVPKGTRTSPRG